jgi:hypothetical protein
VHARTLLVLALVVGALTLLLLREEPEGPGPAETVALVEGVESERVDRVRIEHLERGVVVDLERRREGGWRLVDPLAYPADGGLVADLLASLRRLRGLPVGEADLAALGLDPPRVIVEVHEVTVDGARTHRLELGALDVDGESVFARVRGRVVRVLRTVDTALDRNPDDWRSRRILRAAPEDVVALRRQGTLVLEPDTVGMDVGLEAERGADPFDWRSTHPVDAVLHPLAMGGVLRGLTSMRVQRFHDDSLDPLASYGLEPPALRIDLVLADGTEHALLLGVPPAVGEAAVGPAPAEPPVLERRWLCMLEGGAHVFEVRASDVRLAASPPEDLLDYRMVGGRRDAWSRLVLIGDSHEVELARDGSAWTVRERPRTTGGAWTAAVPAEPGAVDDLLLDLEAAEVALWMPGAELAPPGAQLEGFVLEQDGERWTGALGGEVEAPDGSAGRAFQRGDGQAVFLVAAEQAEFVRTRAGALRSLVVHALDELTLEALTVSLGDVSRSWSRERDGRWHADGTPDVEARELWGVLDRLVSVRAVRWLDSLGSREKGLEVVLRDTDGSETRFLVLAGEGGDELCVTRGRGAAVLEPGLLGALEALLDEER